MSKKPVTLPPIAMKNSCKSVMLRASLKKALVEHVKEEVGTSTAEMKLHPQLVKLVCTMVENSINNNKKKKIDKKALVIEVLSEVFTLNANDKEVLSKDIDFLIDNKLIKKKTIKLLFGSIIRTVGAILNVI